MSIINSGILNDALLPSNDQTELIVETIENQSGTYVVPLGTVSIVIEAIGGGGRSSRITSGQIGGGSGAGGGYSKKTILNPTPGTSYSYQRGVGGQFSVQIPSASFFGSVCIAEYGEDAIDNAITPGNARSTTVGDIVYNGGNGGAGAVGPIRTSSGGGAAGRTGTGTAGGTQSGSGAVILGGAGNSPGGAGGDGYPHTTGEAGSQPGQPGNSYGAGAGAGYRNTGTSQSANGADGWILITIIRANIS